MYYRNRIDLVSNEDIFVDQGSLWKLHGDTLVLEDDDQYATHELTSQFELDT